MKPLQLKNGRWIVGKVENFVNWCAWRSWLHRETGRTVFPEKLCVWGEWPPETQVGAQAVAQKILDTRRDVQLEMPVCDPAAPWQRFSFNERNDLERCHREDIWWEPDLPPYRGEHGRRGPERVLPFNPGAG